MNQPETPHPTSDASTQTSFEDEEKIEFVDLPETDFGVEGPARKRRKLNSPNACPKCGNETDGCAIPYAAFDMRDTCDHAVCCERCWLKHFFCNAHTCPICGIDLGYFANELFESLVVE
jgi:hypothetical protein